MRKFPVISYILFISSGFSLIFAIIDIYYRTPLTNLLTTIMSLVQLILISIVCIIVGIKYKKLKNE